MKYPVLSAYLSSSRNDTEENVDSREEAFGAMKTLKRLERTNFWVRMNRMDDISIYHKISDAQLLSFVYEQSLGSGRY